MLRKILPHGAIIISVMYFVFFFIDKVNEPMAFINNNITKGLLFALCVIAIINALWLIRIDRRRERQQVEQQRRARAGRQPEYRQPEPRSTDYRQAEHRQSGYRQPDYRVRGREDYRPERTASRQGSAARYSGTTGRRY